MLALVSEYRINGKQPSAQEYNRVQQTGFPLQTRFLTSTVSLKVAQVSFF